MVLGTLASVPVVLVTGMSGTGKSSVLAELARRGHRVVDLDRPGWAEEVPAADGPGLEQLWREDRVADLLADRRDGLLVVSGCARNQGRFSDRFDAVVLLTVRVKLLVRRLAARPAGSFGRTADELERVLRDVVEVEPLLRAGADVEIDTDRPLVDVADAVLAVAHAPGVVGADC